MATMATLKRYFAEKTVKGKATVYARILASFVPLVDGRLDAFSAYGVEFSGTARGQEFALALELVDRDADARDGPCTVTYNSTVYDAEYSASPTSLVLTNGGHSITIRRCEHGAETEIVIRPRLHGVSTLHVKQVPRRPARKRPRASAR